MKKGKNTTKKIESTDILVVDESFRRHRKKRNGVIRRQVWTNKQGEVTRYSLAYINHHLFHGDDGRVLGYDNAHGYHHRHYMGQIEPINFKSLESQFEQEFEELHEKSNQKT